MNSSEKAASAILEISAKHSRSSVDSLADAVLHVIGVAQAATLKQSTRIVARQRAVRNRIELSPIRFGPDEEKQARWQPNLPATLLYTKSFQNQADTSNACVAFEPPGVLYP